jgi:serine/threonine-protein kinase RsbW
VITDADRCDHRNSTAPFHTAADRARDRAKRHDQWGVPIMPALMMTAPCRTFEGDFSQVPAARHWLLDQLGGGDHPASWAVELIGTELVTNAVRHTASGRQGGRVTVGVDVCEDGVWIGVKDEGAAREPRIAEHDDGSDGGRGLSLVAAYSKSWGHEMQDEGRLVWCLVSGEDPS